MVMKSLTLMQKHRLHIPCSNFLGIIKQKSHEVMKTDTHCKEKGQGGSRFPILKEDCNCIFGIQLPVII